MKHHAPATLRNREAILGVLRRELPQTGNALEIASGSGEHALYFAANIPAFSWQPSDPDTRALESIAAYRAEYEGENLLAPLMLDAASDTWPIARADAIICINMTHISAWEAAAGLFAGAGRLLTGPSAPLIVYGPYFEAGVQPAPSNLDFDASLKAREPTWGIRQIEDMDAAAAAQGFARTARHVMPANNLALVYRRA